MTKQLSIGRLIALVFFALAIVATDSEAAIGRTRGFAAVSDSGQATYSIPLYTPPGTNGLTPSLSLNYSSNAGNGIFGNGWSLAGLSGISRCSSTWSQDGVTREPRNDNFDLFCLDGQKLRLVSGVYGQSGSTYRTEIESFARITANGSPATGLHRSQSRGRVGSSIRTAAHRTRKSSRLARRPFDSGLLAGSEIAARSPMAMPSSLRTPRMPRTAVFESRRFSTRKTWRKVSLLPTRFRSTMSQFLQPKLTLSTRKAHKFAA